MEHALTKTSTMAKRFITHASIAVLLWSPALAAVSTQLPPAHGTNSSHAAMSAYRAARELLERGEYDAGYRMACQARDRFSEVQSAPDELLLEKIELARGYVQVRLNMGSSEMHPPEHGIIRPLTFSRHSRDRPNHVIESFDYEVGFFDGKPSTAAIGQTFDGAHSSIEVFEPTCTYSEIRSRFLKHFPNEQAVDISTLPEPLLFVETPRPVWNIKEGAFPSAGGRYALWVYPKISDAPHAPQPMVLRDNRSGNQLWRCDTKICLDGILVQTNGVVWVDDWDLIYGIDLDGKILTESYLEWRQRFPQSYQGSGPFWGWRESYRYFLEHNDRVYFCLRPWWDQRLVIDLLKGEYITEIGSLKDACIEKEKAWVRRTLEFGLSSACDTGDMRAWVRTTLRIAGTYNDKTFIPLLRQYEQDDWPVIQRPVAIRGLAQLSLRRLGCVPNAEAPYMLSVPRAEGGATFITSPIGDARTEAAQGIEAGLSRHSLLNTLGVPDLIRYRPMTTWEYDIDSVSPYTLTITWTNDLINTAVINRPPAWAAGDDRDRSWFNSY